jgi:hypothetical protein
VEVKKLFAIFRVEGRIVHLIGVLVAITKLHASRLQQNCITLQFGDGCFKSA